VVSLHSGQVSFVSGMMDNCDTYICIQQQFRMLRITKKKKNTFQSLVNSNVHYGILCTDTLIFLDIEFGCGDWEMGL